MKTKQVRSDVLLATVAAAMLFLIMTTAAQAQMDQRNGSQSGAQSEQAQDGSDDGMQQGAGNQVDSADDRDPNADSATSMMRSQAQGDSVAQQQNQAQQPAGTPDQDQIQTQDQTREPDGTPDQDRLRDQDRTQAQSPEELNQFIQTQTQTQTQARTDDGNFTESRMRARVAADAVVAAERMLGANGPRMGQLAQEMSQSMSRQEDQEQVLQNRSRLQLFLFGQDDEAVQIMQQEMLQNQERISDMIQYMKDCTDCDQQATGLLVTQIQSMEQEQNRLQAVADEADSRRGLFGFLFGWMR